MPRVGNPHVSRIWAGERRRSDGDPWGAIERSRSESRRGVTRRGDRELKPSDCPAVHGPPAAVPGFQGASALWRAGVRGWRGPSPGNAARGTPSPACPCGWGRPPPRKRREGHAVAGMPVRVAAVAIPPRSRRPSAPSRSRWSRHPRNRFGRPPIRRCAPTRPPRTSRRR